MPNSANRSSGLSTSQNLLRQFVDTLQLLCEFQISFLFILRNLDGLGAPREAHLKFLFMLQGRIIGIVLMYKFLWQCKKICWPSLLCIIDCRVVGRIFSVFTPCACHNHMMKYKLALNSGISHFIDEFYDLLMQANTFSDQGMRNGLLTVINFCSDVTCNQMGCVYYITANLPNRLTNQRYYTLLQISNVTWISLWLN